MRFTKAQIRSMQSMYERGYAVQYIARKFRCYGNAVWNHVYNLSAPRVLSPGEMRQRKGKLTAKQVRGIRDLAIKKGLSAEAIASMFEISTSCALGVIRGKTYRWVAGDIRPRMSEPLVRLVPDSYPKHPAKSDLRRGFKAGVSKRLVAPGVLLKLSEMTGLSPSRLSRMLRGK